MTSVRGTPTHNSWRGMRERCSSPKHESYAHYGGRGIAVCERWQEFDTFLADMGERPEGLTLERIDNDGPYSPGNCRWATPSEQRLNSRSANVIEFNGERLHLIEWAARLGIRKQCLKHRLSRGWPLAKALASIALICLVSNAAYPHSWYPPECCSGQDCRPVPQGEAREGAGGTLVILINGTWRVIPPEVIRLQPSPDGLLHVCYSRYPGDSMPRLYCVFLPAAM